MLIRSSIVSKKLALVVWLSSSDKVKDSRGSATDDPLFACYCNCYWLFALDDSSSSPAKCGPTIFTTRSHLIGETRFLLKWKAEFYKKKKKLESPLTFIYLFLKGKTIKNKTPKRTLDFLQKLSAKNLSLGSGIRLPIKKVPSKR